MSSCCVRISCVERKPESHDLSAKNKHRGALRLAGKDALDATEASINTQGACDVHTVYLCRCAFALFFNLLAALCHTSVLICRREAIVCVFNDKICICVQIKPDVGWV